MFCPVESPPSANVFPMKLPLACAPAEIVAAWYCCCKAEMSENTLPAGLPQIWVAMSLPLMLVMTDPSGKGNWPAGQRVAVPKNRPFCNRAGRSNSTLLKITFS